MAAARIVKHAMLSIEVAEGSVTDAFDRVAGIAAAHGGFVVSSSTSSFDDGEASAELTLRVPAEQFEAARADLAGVGEQRSVRVGGEDVTAQQSLLDDRASFPTLEVSLSEPGAIAAGPEPESATGLARSFDRALDASVAVAGGMVVVLGYLLPLGVLALLAWGAVRVARLRRRPA